MKKKKRVESKGMAKRAADMKSMMPPPTFSSAKVAIDKSAAAEQPTADP